MVPKLPFVSESMEADLKDNFYTVRLLVSTLGYPVIEIAPKIEDPSDIFLCGNKDSSATGEYTDDGFLVFKGSKAAADEVKSASDWIVTLRNKLKESEVVIESNQQLEFQKDHMFDSPSAAAAVVLGRTANGWIEWKDESGKTLDELKRSK